MRILYLVPTASAIICVDDNHCSDNGCDPLTIEVGNAEAFTYNFPTPLVLLSDYALLTSAVDIT